MNIDLRQRVCHMKSHRCPDFTKHVETVARMRWVPFLGGRGGSMCRFFVEYVMCKQLVKTATLGNYFNVSFCVRYLSGNAETWAESVLRGGGVGGVTVHSPCIDIAPKCSPRLAGQAIYVCCVCCNFTLMGKRAASICHKGL